MDLESKIFWVYVDCYHGDEILFFFFFISTNVGNSKKINSGFRIPFSKKAKSKIYFFEVICQLFHSSSKINKVNCYVALNFTLWFFSPSKKIAERVLQCKRDLGNDVLCEKCVWCADFLSLS